MRLAALILIGAIAAFHGYIAWFEMFAWETRGPKVFTTMDPELFPKTVTLAANQGLYNGFLAAGLVWSLLIRDRAWQRNVAVCFLLFVLVAGVFGAATASMRILYVQALPALVALSLLLVSARSKAR
jgi:putative membrane protein